MTTPIPFDSATPRFGLPLLFVGQAQKEAFVNEAHIITDAIVHCAVSGEASAPPATAIDGECWLVAPSPTGAWAGHAGQIACPHAGDWLFVTPRDGMHVLDRATGQDRRYHGTWRAPEVPATPTGGTTVDAEARSAILALVEALRDAGIFPD